MTVIFNFYDIYSMKEKLLTSLKAKAMVVRSKYADDPVYFWEKSTRVKNITHREDAYILVNMFDPINQAELRNLLNEEEKSEFWKHFYPHIREQCNQQKPQPK